MQKNRKEHADEVEECDTVEARSVADEAKRGAEIERLENENENENEIDVENQNGESDVGIEKALREADVCEVYDARQPSVSGERVLRGNEKRQRWDDVPQHTEQQGHMHVAEGHVTVLVVPRSRFFFSSDPKCRERVLRRVAMLEKPAASASYKAE